MPGVPPVLQPVAHALQHAVEDVRAALDAFPDGRLWDRPAGVASVGFHLRHMAGVLGRMTTYARGAALSDRQLAALAAEEAPGRETTAELVSAFEAAVEGTIGSVRATDPATVYDARAVGRKGLPTTVLGLLVHAAEHTQRHVGQLLVTARVVRG
ncbi:MAG TPA: DinB family protein [Rubricoccaceae bacterium]